MINKFFLLVTLLIMLLSCGQQQVQDKSSEQDDMIDRIESMESDMSDIEKAFLDNLASFCGKSFRGKESYSAPGRESWADKDFIMHVTVCEPDKVYIPFHLDEDRSRTWMFIAGEQGLRFRHDHRHDDGTPEELTMYGGYADGTGTAYMQKFPADEYTVELLDDVFNREWRVIITEDLSALKYQLLYHGELVFAAEFDLLNPL